VSTKIKAQRKVNETETFVDEVETQLREKPLRGSQTQEFHYSEDIARYKTVTLTCIQACWKYLNEYTSCFSNYH
jgi:cytochrome oxidase assembly protein ShyY1